MKVTGNNGVNIIKLYSDNKTKSAQNKDKINSKQDTIEISKQGLEISNYVTMVNKMPDVRTDKINKLKNQIQSGSYSISSEELASKIFETINEGKNR